MNVYNTMCAPVDAPLCDAERRCAPKLIVQAGGGGPMPPSVMPKGVEHMTTIASLYGR